MLLMLMSLNMFTMKMVRNLSRYCLRLPLCLLVIPGRVVLISLAWSEFCLLLPICLCLYFIFDPRLLLHGQQYIELYKPFPSSCHIHNKISLAGLHDKGKAAILEIETKSYEKDSGDLLCMNRTTVFLRGAGGFSKSSEPFSYTNYPLNQTSAVKIPESKPFSVFEDCTQPSQALLYRLSGDYNALHSDPIIAKVAGFSQPILHGLCTLGFAVRAIIKCICRGDQDLIKSIAGRFLLHVYPGETLVTEMWLEGLRVIYRTKAKERKRTVLSGYVDLRGLTSSL
ncbi:enoyl-CoA hydratase 2, peroxisomal isoform X2 [Phaseolus vulgaris]|uniref:enoyl-CoA hydratase 2, peroxisomal isoform X2 n=1 Tax=Phaseolus vulgaris TaxID=3885 RepID=UPI0035CB3423